VNFTLFALELEKDLYYIVERYEILTFIEVPFREYKGLKITSFRPMNFKVYEV
jgi:hypothetical protein